MADSPVYDPNFIKLVQSALAKKRAGTPLKREEKRALERYQKDEEERSAKRHYGAIAKKLWVQWSGRQHKVLDDQAATHGLPVSGDTIDLPAVVRWLHDFLAENTHKLRRGEPDEEGDPEKYERIRKLRLGNEAAEYELGELKRRLIDRHEVHDAAAAIAALLRTGLDRLAREHGEEALRIMLEKLDDAERLIAERWGTTAGDSEEPEAEQRPDDDAAP